jgi:asparagine synthase (glutamine-hydrolysing)
MSAIAALFHRDGRPADASVVTAMIAAQRRRGPDAQRVHVTGSVGLGQAALFTTRESEREAQPLTLDGSSWIAADARIDARDDLRAALSAAGHAVPADATDAALILYAYHAWGEACVERLVGEFAFVIWDERAGRLFCARDHTGCRSLYLHVTDALFACASMQSGVLAVPDIPRRLDEGRIADYLVGFLEGIDTTATWYRDLQRLPPATCLTVTPDRVTRRTYWTPDPRRTLRFRSDDEAVEAFRAIFTAAVTDRLREPDRVGSMLSGGIDSSSVVGFARQHLRASGGSPLPVFSAVSADGSDVETQIIHAALTLDHLEAHLLTDADYADLAPDLNALYDAADDPFDMTMPIPQAMYALAARRGLKALLDGVAGDLVTTLGGNHLTFVIRGLNPLDIVREARGLQRLYHRFPETGRDLLITHAKAALAPAWWTRWRLRTTRARRAETARAEGFIHPDFARRVDLAGRLARFDDHSSSSRTQRDDHVRRLLHPFLAVGLERYDRVAGFYGIEARHPYQDVRLIEFFIALDWRHKDHRGWSKILNRRALIGLLPDEVIWATPRQNLSPPFWRARIGAIAGLDAALERAEFLDALAAYLDLPAARAALARYRSGEVAGDPGLWNWYALARWLRRAC